jgi:sugar O-acyltransferase (sialic acid O-acetyltransferase NeuD family)
MMPFDTLTVLGCSPNTLPILFDVAYEALGLRSFRIVKNIPVDGEPRLEIGEPLYRYSIHEPGEDIQLKDENLFFGVVGARSKTLVYAYFEEKYEIGRSSFVTLIHPKSYVAVSSRLEHGVLVEPNAAISSQTRVGFGVTIKRGVCVGHHNLIEDFAEINPGAVLSGNVHIGRACTLGAGSVIRDGVSIGENTLIGMGSVVTEDIPEGVVAYGNPCKVVRANDSWKS